MDKYCPSGFKSSCSITIPTFICVSRLLATANPITDSESGQQLQKAYARQLISDLKSNILKDPNYSAGKFPNLAKMMK